MKIFLDNNVNYYVLNSLAHISTSFNPLTDSWQHHAAIAMLCYFAWPNNEYFAKESTPFWMVHGHYWTWYPPREHSQLATGEFSAPSTQLPFCCCGCCARCLWFSSSHQLRPAYTQLSWFQLQGGPWHSGLIMRQALSIGLRLWCVLCAIRRTRGSVCPGSRCGWLAGWLTDWLPRLVVAAC